MINKHNLPVCYYRPSFVFRFYLQTLLAAWHEGHFMGSTHIRCDKGNMLPEYLFPEKC